MEAKSLADMLDVNVENPARAYDLLSGLLKEESRDAHLDVRTIIGRRWMKSNQDNNREEIDKYSCFLVAINKLILNKNGKYFRE